MNPALWKKAVSDTWVTLAWLVLLLFCFAWLFVWLSSKIELPAFYDFLLNALPPEWERLSSVSFREMATVAGRIALAFVDPVVIFAVAAWSIARGSDIVAGEVGRGTMEMILAQPVRRIEVFVSQTVVTTLGSGLLAAAVWLGTFMGIATVTLPAAVPASLFVPAAINLFGKAFFVTGVATLLSCWDSHRWRVIGVASGFFVISIIIKLAGRMAAGWSWLLYGSFLTVYEPQAFVARPDEAMVLLVQYNGVLIGLGLILYVAGAVIFCRRDLPAPL